MRYGWADLFSIGSIVGSTDYMVLHRSVELAALIGNWELPQAALELAAAQAA
jgi:hypothetical protein